MKRIIIFPGILILWQFACLSQQVDTIRVNVHGHQITLYVSGKSGPVVVLEAGGGTSHRAWQRVQPALAGITRVVSYDRPGYLNSDSCSSQRDALTIAKELKLALTIAGIQPPYILSGWSLGGTFIRVYAGLFPQDVIGMVLVDPAPEGFYPRLKKEIPEFVAEEAKYINEVMNGKGPQGEKGEMKQFDSSMSQARRSDAMHSTPTTLLIAAGKVEGGQDRDQSNPINRAWVEELVIWGKKRPNLEYRIITNSGHNIARFQPDTVINAIKHHIERYRDKPSKKTSSISGPPLLNNNVTDFSQASNKKMGITFLPVTRRYSGQLY
jgi:pimeloyl-ACP methyl ester carboxylesterase